jgi:cytochrome c2
MIKKREWVIETFGVSFPVGSMALAVLALVVSSVVLPSEAEAQAGQDGQALFQRHCSGATHSTIMKVPARAVVGRPAGTVKTFPLSEALKEAKHTWDEGTLDEWLTDTESVVPDNNKSFRVPKRPMLKSSIKRSNSMPGEQLALRDVAADRFQASVKHDLSTWDTSSLLAGRVVGAGIFVVPTGARTLCVELLNYNHTYLSAAQEKIRERF